jgi:hypothetical protein
MDRNEREGGARCNLIADDIEGLEIEMAQDTSRLALVLRAVKARAPTLILSTIYTDKNAAFPPLVLSQRNVYRSRPPTSRLGDRQSVRQW